jgi:alkanesulfonate monooxygenase SsuD/methylene tetrahydromethanopterin reductase-like flavin-dependent oxidoreductase (luciferase family)
MTTPTLGVVFRPQLPPERLRAAVETADHAGLAELWLWEDCFLESGIASAAAALAWTQRLRVGVGLLPVPLRNVALTAMEVATLSRLFPDRLRLAVGHGVQDWMGQVGARVESPLTLLREYVTALRTLLDGRPVTAEGRYVRLQDVALGWPPASPPPLLVGAVRPRTLQLSGEVADGTVLVAGTTPEQVREVRALVDAADPGAGRKQPHSPHGLRLGRNRPGCRTAHGRRIACAVARPRRRRSSHWRRLRGRRDSVDASRSRRGHPSANRR